MHLRLICLQHLKKKDKNGILYLNSLALNTFNVSEFPLKKAFNIKYLVNFFSNSQQTPKPNPLHLKFQVVRENGVTQLRSPLFNDFLPTLYSAWRGENRVFTDDDSIPPLGGNIEFDGNVCTTF